MPMAAMLLPLIPNFSIASKITVASVAQISFGLCSTQPDVGKYCVNSFCATAQLSPCLLNMMARELLVP